MRTAGNAQRNFCDSAAAYGCNWSEKPVRSPTHFNDSHCVDTPKKNRPARGRSDIRDDPKSTQDHDIIQGKL